MIDDEEERRRMLAQIDFLTDIVRPRTVLGADPAWFRRQRKLQAMRRAVTGESELPTDTPPV